MSQGRSETTAKVILVSKKLVTVAKPEIAEKAPDARSNYSGFCQRSLPCGSPSARMVCGPHEDWSEGVLDAKDTWGRFGLLPKSIHCPQPIKGQLFANCCLNTTGDNPRRRNCGRSSL